MSSVIWTSQPLKDIGGLLCDLITSVIYLRLVSMLFCSVMIQCLHLLLCLLCYWSTTLTMLHILSCNNYIFITVMLMWVLSAQVHQRQPLNILPVVEYQKFIKYYWQYWNCVTGMLTCVWYLTWNVVSVYRGYIFDVVVQRFSTPLHFGGP
jgi:hypothetical protein